MKFLIRFFAKFYPSSWRQRYGAEFDAMIGDVDADWRTAFDILKGGLDMQLRTWRYGKVIAITAAAGALIAWGISFAIPKSYSSAAVLAVKPAGAEATKAPAALNQEAANAVLGLAMQVMSRTSLIGIIRNEGLYQRERGTKPLEDVVQQMKGSITIAPVAAGKFEVQFTYGDAAKAQVVAKDLAMGFVDAANSVQSVGMLELSSSPARETGPRPSRVTVVGLLLGLAMGILMSWFSRRRASQKSA
jgi:capsular polysaccharide biosynthesis protein